MSRLENVVVLGPGSLDEIARIAETRMAERAG